MFAYAYVIANSLAYLSVVLRAKRGIGIRAQLPTANNNERKIIIIRKLEPYEC